MMWSTRVAGVRRGKVLTSGNDKSGIDDRHGQGVSDGTLSSWRHIALFGAAAPRVVRSDVDRGGTGFAESAGRLNSLHPAFWHGLAGRVAKLMPFPSLGKGLVDVCRIPGVSLDRVG